MKHIFRSWNKVFRSWNEELKQFFYFEGGIYQRCGIDRDEFNLSLFKWQNAEQGIDVKEENNKPIFLNDRLHVIITFGANVKASCDEEGTCFNGILKQDNIWFYIYLEKEDKKLYLYEFENGNRVTYFLIGNIHQNKELLEQH